MNFLKKRRIKIQFSFSITSTIILFISFNLAIFKMINPNLFFISWSVGWGLFGATIISYVIWDQENILRRILYSTMSILLLSFAVFLFWFGVKGWANLQEIRQYVLFLILVDILTFAPMLVFFLHHIVK